LIAVGIGAFSGGAFYTGDVLVTNAIQGQPFLNDWSWSDFGWSVGISGATAGALKVPPVGRLVSKVTTWMGNALKPLESEAGFVRLAAVSKNGGFHDIASNKSFKSGFTKSYQNIFNKAGMSLEDPENIVYLKGHNGVHTIAYKQYVLRYFDKQTKGFSGTAYKQALQQALNDLKIQLIKNPRMPFAGGM
jgi:hypothetical protein